MQKYRILIADDEKNIRITLKVIFDRLDYETVCVANGNEALDQLIAHQNNGTPFDLLLCDLQMPVLTGEELIQKMLVREIATPVLVITGVGDKELIIRLIRLGIRDFIEKPFSVEEIEKRVSALVKNINTEKLEKDRKEFMTRIGEIAHASIHDSNNAAGAKLDFADNLPGDISKEHPMYRGFSRIFNCAGRTRQICRELLSIDPFTTPSCKIKTDLNVLIEKIAVLLEDITPESVTIKTGRRKIPLWISADAWQIQHALLHLGFNAIDAMPEGGILEFYLDVQCDEYGAKYACVEVKDNGEGINAGMLGKLFDGGITIKVNGCGTGLINVNKIVEEHGGAIRVASTVGKGTCFTINLPLK